MSKPAPAPTVTIDLTPVYAAIDAVQANVDSLTQRVAVLETPPPVAAPAPAPAPSVPADSPAFLAAKAQYETNMTVKGKAVWDFLNDPNQTDAAKRDATYYDGPKVFKLIQAYTNDATWQQAALLAKQYYHEYIDENAGRIAGRWLFPHGLHMMGDDATVTLLALNAENAQPVLEWTVSAHASREVAYMTQTKLIAVTLGTVVDKLEEQAAQMFGHIAQWTQTLNGQPMTGIPDGQPVDNYCRPFMAALTSYAMIEWAGTDATRLKQVLDTLTPFWQLVWDKCFLAQQPVPNNPALGLVDTMMYTNCIAPDGSGGQDPSPDLNLLIAPVYAWLYAQTKDASWRDKHDRLFIGGVQGAYLEPKQFNQNYEYSFQGLEWRKS